MRPSERKAKLKSRTEELFNNGLTIGTVCILTANVQNPVADLRNKTDWRRHAVIKKGSRFVVEDQGENGVCFPALTLRMPGNGNDTSISCMSDLFPELLPFLQKEMPTFDDILAEHGNPKQVAYDVIKLLMETWYWSHSDLTTLTSGKVPHYWKNSVD